MNDNIRPEVMRFARSMESKLKNNDHKGGWSNDDPITLLNKLIVEVYELQNELDEAIGPESIVSKCVDVANYAMMIAEQFDADTKPAGAASMSDNASDDTYGYNQRNHWGAA